MLSRRYRLTKKDHLSSILKKGDTLKSRLLVARFRKNDKEHHRFSVIISNKVLPKAVDRNHIKQQLYEIIRLNYDQFQQNAYFDILILPKKAIIGTTYSELETTLLKLLSKFQ